MPDHTELYDAVAGDYHATWDASSVSLDLARFAAEVAPGPVLDAGCGHGRDLAAFASLGVPAVGVDLSSAMVRLAATGGAALVGDLGGLPFAEGSFAGVWASASLVHFDDTEALAVLRELLRVTRPGGCAHVTVKAASPDRRGAGVEPGGQLGYDGGRWFRWWTVEEFTNLARTAGWEVRSAGLDDDSRRPDLQWVSADLVAPGG